MELKDRFLKYVSFDTQSDESSETFPSTAKQRVLLDYLAEEMKALGLTEVTVDKYGYAMGTIPATPGCEKAPVIGFIAHVDTAPDMSGADVKPHVIENYDGKDIRLNAGVTMKVADFPELSFFKGHTLIHTDGTTLLGADDKAGVAVTERGFIDVNIQMRTNVPHIFAIGDIVGQPMLAHKAVHEAHVAAEVIAGELQGNKELAAAAFNARVIPSVAYTDPEVAWVGLTEDQAKAQGIQVKKGLFPWAASGRAIANGRDEGFTKLLFDAHTHRILGGGIVGTHAGDMIGEIALAIEMGADSVDIGKTIHPHPTLGESIGMAAEVAHGSCTDVPPQRK